MPSRVRCFLLTPTEQVAVSLRRYAIDDAPPCTRREARYPGAEVVAYTVHDVEVEVAREVSTLESSLDGDRTQRTLQRDDPWWPTACVCGYLFKDTDPRQENRVRLYRREDTGELMTVDAAPAGALYDARFLHHAEYQRNGELSLVCKTPAGEWYIDGPASNGPGWSRTGTPPDIVVMPSIGIGSPQRMHGWLGGPSHNEPGWLVIDSP